MSALELAILDAFKRAANRPCAPTSIYLTDADRAELGRDTVDGLPVRPVRGKGGSRLYLEGGSAVSISRRRVA